MLSTGKTEERQTDFLWIVRTGHYKDWPTSKGSIALLCGTLDPDGGGVQVQEKAYVLGNFWEFSVFNILKNTMNF